MAKSYDKGSEEAAEALAAGKGKPYILRNLKNAFDIFPGAENRIAERERGFNETYEKGTKIKNILNAVPLSQINSATSETTKNSNGGANMSRGTSFAHQIELLNDLKEYLQKTQERLLGVGANYRRKVNVLHEEGGLMDETYRDFLEDCLEPTNDMIKRLVDHIEENDIPAVEREIAYLEEKV